MQTISQESFQANIHDLTDSASNFSLDHNCIHG